MTMREVAITVLSAALAGGISWGVMTERVATLESRILEVELRQDKKDEQTTLMLTKLTEMSTDMKWIKEAIIKKEK